VSPFSFATRLMVLSGLAAITVLVLGSWLLRDQIYQTFQDPGEPFQTYAPPDPADYAQADGWYAQADFADDDEPAVFFVHSTTYSGGANWNAQLDKPGAVEAVTEISLPNYAAPFAASGGLFAPRYRQAALYAFMNNREDGILARLFAYQDVDRAFDAFLADTGPDRPIILVGVGQGGLHVLGLLVNRVSNTPELNERLIAAYILESPVPLDLFEGPLTALPPCQTPEDVRCVFAYTAALPSEDRRIRVLTEHLMSWTPDGDLGFVDGRGLLCVNPLLSARSADYASPRLHRGGVAAEGLPADAVPAPIPSQTGAQCTAGLLMTEQARSSVLRRPGRLAEDFRVPPYNLFYEDLRLDAARRSFNLGTILREERRWAPPLEGPEDIRTAPVTPIPDRRRDD
jgi:hypothetical protein